MRTALTKPFHFIAAGTSPSRHGALASIFALAAGQDVSIVGVEAPAGYVFHQARSAQLLKTSAIAGDLRTLARDRGYPVVDRSAQDIRRAFCGVNRGPGTAGDDAVKASVLRLVSGLPKRTSNHVRDALLCAIFAVSNPGLAVSQ